MSPSDYYLGVFGTIYKGTLAAVYFTQQVVATNTPGMTPNGIVSPGLGRSSVWTPTAMTVLNGQGYLKGASGWWPAGACAAFINDAPIETRTNCWGTVTPCFMLKLKWGAPDANGYVQNSVGYAPVIDCCLSWGGTPVYPAP